LAEKVTSGAQQAVQEKGQQAKEQVQQVAGSAQDRMREQVDTRSTEAGHQVDSVAEAMRKASEHLSGQGNQLPAQAAEQLAQKAEQLGRYLRESDADRILSDLEDFGRRQPLVVVAAGLAIGVAAARFLKASSRRRYQQSQSRSEPSGYPHPELEPSTYSGEVYPRPAPGTYPSSQPLAGTYPPPAEPRT
jgi:uncharacterized membrane-anchored protein YhcB (DUF1043 family)